MRIAVVGGGIAGCAAALMLARDGHDIELLEQTPHIGPVGAGILIQPSGQAILAELGLLETIVARSARIEALLAWTHRGRELSRLVYADRDAGLHALGVHRADLFEPLHGACEQAGVRIRLGETIVATRRTDRGRTLIRADASPDALPDECYDLVIAADGSRSRLRQSSGLPSFVHSYGPGALWAIGAAPWPSNQLIQYTRGTAELCGLLPMGGGRCSFFWGIDSRVPGNGFDPKHGERRSESFDAWRERVARLAPPAEPIVAALRGWGDLTCASYRAVVMPRMIADRFALLGDAAHAAGPHLGQGANLALLDAACLRDALRSSTSLPDALERFNARQRWRNAWYSLATAALMPSFQGSGWPIGVARDWALPRMQRIGPLRQVMLRTLCGS